MLEDSDLKRISEGLQDIIPTTTDHPHLNRILRTLETLLRVSKLAKILSGVAHPVPIAQSSVLSTVDTLWSDPLPFLSGVRDRVDCEQQLVCTLLRVYTCTYQFLPGHLLAVLQ